MIDFDSDPNDQDEILVVRLPDLPPTPNVRRHWRQVAADNRLWKDAAYVVATGERIKWEKRNHRRWQPIARATVSVAFGLKDKRRHDLDNLIASIKPVIDGIVQAEILVDDSIEVITKMEFGAAVTGTAELVVAVLWTGREDG